MASLANVIIIRSSFAKATEDNVSPSQKLWRALPSEASAKEGKYYLINSHLVSFIYSYILD
jgi:hypothetical protein